MQAPSSGMAAAMVECHSGSAYAERPVVFVWEGQRLPVAALVGRWREPSGPHFRVRSPDGRIFELAYDEHGEEWRVDQA